MLEQRKIFFPEDSHKRNKIKNGKKNLWLYLYFPKLLLQIIAGDRIEKEACILLDANSKVLLANRKALLLGVEPGVSKDFVPKDIIKCFVRDEILERERLFLLLKCVSGFSSILVNEWETEGLALEIGKSKRLFGSLENLVSRLSFELKKINFFFSYSVTPVKLASMVLSKDFRKSIILEKNALASVLNAISIDHISINLPDLHCLNDIGIKNLGDYKKLPLKGLHERLPINVINLIDELYGELILSNKSYLLQRNFHQSLDFIEPSSSANIIFYYVKIILSQLKIFLAERALITNCVKIFLTGNNFKKNVGVSFSKPSRNVDLILSHIENKFSSIKLESEINQIAIKVDLNDCRKINQNGDLWGDNYFLNSSYDQVVEKVKASFGGKSLFSLSCNFSHVPEKKYKKNYLLVGNKSAKKHCCKMESISGRPLWLLEVPRKLIFKNGKIYLNGYITIVSERERIVTGWWQSEIARDYFIAITKNHLKIWVYKEINSEQNWYLHGIFD